MHRIRRHNGTMGELGENWKSLGMPSIDKGEGMESNGFLDLRSNKDSKLQ